MSPNLLSCLAVVLLASCPTTSATTVASCSVSATTDSGDYFRISETCAHCAGISSNKEFTVSVERAGVIVESRLVDIWTSSGAQSYSPSTLFAEYHGRRGPNVADRLSGDWQLGDRLIFPVDYIASSSLCETDLSSSPMTDITIRIAVAAWLADATAAEATYGHISTWETSGVTDMSDLFCAYQYSSSCNTAAASFNEDIGAWDTSGVTAMYDMFWGASAFNQDISGWAVHSVTRMYGMFKYASAFDQDLGWCVDHDIDFDPLGYGYTIQDTFHDTQCESTSCGVIQGTCAPSPAPTPRPSAIYGYVMDDRTIRCAVGARAPWACASVETYGHISTWDTSGVTDMENLFDNDLTFNEDIGAWDTSSVTSMYQMFRYATSFNQDLSDWRVEKVKRMSGMFSYASAFNQDLG